MLALQFVTPACNRSTICRFLPIHYNVIEQSLYGIAIFASIQIQIIKFKSLNKNENVLLKLP